MIRTELASRDLYVIHSLSSASLHNKYCINKYCSNRAGEEIRILNEKVNYISKDFFFCSTLKTSLEEYNLG